MIRGTGRKLTAFIPSYSHQPPVELRCSAHQVAPVWQCRFTNLARVNRRVVGFLRGWIAEQSAARNVRTEALDCLRAESVKKGVARSEKCNLICGYAFRRGIATNRHERRQRRARISDSSPQP